MRGEDWREKEVGGFKGGTCSNILYMTEEVKLFKDELRRIAKEDPEYAKEFFDAEYPRTFSLAKKRYDLSIVKIRDNFLKWYKEQKENNKTDLDPTESPKRTLDEVVQDALDIFK